MGIVKVKIDWCDTNYSAASENDDIACVATGKTLADVKENFKEALLFHIEGMQEDQLPLSAELSGDIVFEYHFTARAMLKYSDIFISRKALASASGINEQQLSHYATGFRNAKPSTTQKIAAGIQAISDELSRIS